MIPKSGNKKKHVAAGTSETMKLTHDAPALFNTAALN